MRFRPDILTTLTLPAGPVELDEAGFLVNPDLWTKDFAEHIAQGENITLTSQHWEIIAFMRDSLAEHGVAIDVRHVLKLLQNQQNISKSAAKQQLFNLFPYGYVKQACKISGMKQPRAWSTG
ncbi:MAG: TusE/DsrC/DsvC family sulfur relay protein [Rhodobacteraceae bacterium]|nr:TusE/DsrC/DsvC family sulfur relay protein [Paracoccaceae bacterium]